MNIINLDVKRIPFFICVGTPLNNFDCAAPMLGSVLKELGFNVFGTMEHPIHAKNIQNYIHVFNGLQKGILGEIYQVIGIDASINMDSSLWYRVFNEPLEPGAGIGRALPSIGEASIHINVMRDYEKFRKLRLVLQANSPSVKQSTYEAVEHLAHKLILYYSTWGDMERVRSIRTARAFERIVVHDESLQNIAKTFGVGIATIHNYLYNNNTVHMKHNKSKKLINYTKKVLNSHQGRYTPKNRLALLLQEEH